MGETRRQLTLFVSNLAEPIEKIRAEYNPEQHRLIAAHVTLCREDELVHLEAILKNLQSLSLPKPLQIKFGSVERFYEGKGLLLPAKEENYEFIELRKSVLGLAIDVRNPQAHITLMHPRNSTCNDATFELIKKIELPIELYFDKIHLIEQINGGIWVVLKEFSIVHKF